MSIRNCRSTLLLAVAITVHTVVAGRVEAQEPESQLLTLGHATTVYSRVLGEERPILVDLPTGYEFTQTRFPVLFLLDGLGNFHHATATADFLARSGKIPQMIVVGIPNTARTRDLTPTSVEDRSTSGGAPAFLEFIEDELIPYLDDRYRTQPYRVLFGHSLGGTFVVYTMFSEPDLFDAYIAASPHLQFDDGHVVDLVGEVLADKPALDNSLYVTLGDEPEYEETLNRFTGLLEKAGDSGIRWEFAAMDNEDHMSTPLLSIYNGLEMIFSDWRYPGDLAEADIGSLQSHYEALSDELGYDVLIPEGLLNQLGYLFLSQEDFDAAIAAFKLNIDNYPESANVYDSLGEGYETMNELSLAKVYYEKAYKRGLEIQDPNTRIYKLHLDILLEKLSAFD